MSSVTEAVAKRAATILQRCQKAATLAGRDGEAVNLIAASKTQSPERVRAAWQGGIRHFGENYLQDALAKQVELTDLPICWHFIGRVQSNKTRDVATHFDWVHTVDRPRIARRLAQHRDGRAPLNVLMQINVDGDADKGGIPLADAEAVEALATEIAAQPTLRLRGAMTILSSQTDAAAGYRSLSRWFESQRPLRSESWDTLSMGMSADFEAAIACGAHFVRVGTQVFGPRER